MSTSEPRPKPAEPSEAGQAARGERFRALHAGPAFVIPNPWDAGSAKVLEALGFEALATSSSALAFTLGRSDGEATLDDVVAHVASLCAATDLPVSVDLENGYGPAPEAAARAIEAVAAAGAVGGSIEDFDPDGGLYAIEVAAERVAAAVAAAAALPFEFTLTARAENHIRGNPDLDDTIARLAAFERAGADVVYAPGLADAGEVRAVSAATERPLNVLAFPSMSMAALVEAGAQRVSVGGSLTWAAVEAMASAATAIRDGGDFSGLRGGSRVEGWLGAPDLNGAGEHDARTRVPRGSRPAMAGIEITEDKEQSRYEARVDGEVVGVGDYVGQEGIRSFTHTETFAGHKGHGVAGAIVERALVDARADGVEVMPFCSFVADYIGKHREYVDLVPPDRRAEFGLPTGD